MSDMTQNPKPDAIVMERAREKAAQAWCQPTTEKLAMIPELCEAFAESLAFYMAQIDRLAQVILSEIPGEPSKDQGAVDTAIRLLRAHCTPAPCPLCKAALESRGGYYTCPNKACCFPLGIAPALPVPAEPGPFPLEGRGGPVGYDEIWVNELDGVPDGRYHFPTLAAAEEFNRRANTTLIKPVRFIRAPTQGTATPGERLTESELDAAVKLYGDIMRGRAPGYGVGQRAALEAVIRQNRAPGTAAPAGGLDLRELERIRSGLSQVLHDDGPAHVPQAFRDMAALLAEIDRLRALQDTVAPAAGVDTKAPTAKQIEDAMDILGRFVQPHGPGATYGQGQEAHNIIRDALSTPSQAPAGEADHG